MLVIQLYVIHHNYYITDCILTNVGLISNILSCSCIWTWVYIDKTLTLVCSCNYIHMNVHIQVLESCIQHNV